MAKQSDTDLYTKRGAEALAERIERFWRSRGYRGVTVQPFQIPGFAMWGIRSNLIGGCPPRRSLC
jgi:hypothetical protein